MPRSRTIHAVQSRTGRRTGRGRVVLEEDAPVRGTVRLMTDEPIVVTSLDGAPSLRERVSDVATRRPWLFPAVLLTSAALYLVVRRR